jgi:hypothetical protein
MKKTIVVLVLYLALPWVVFSQGKYLTNNGVISFYSHTVIEDITAVNNEVAAVIDGQSGEIAIILKMMDFQFKKKMMQEHFNENYVESEIFPKATFSGFILNNMDIDYSTPGLYEVKVKGEMFIHGKTKSVSAEGTVEVSAGGIVCRTNFKLNPEDYNIKIPGTVRKNISEQMEITAELTCEPI